MDTLTRDFIAAHQPVTLEVQTTLPITHGTLPKELRGVLYRNGGGRFSVGGQHYGHLFDGDGMVQRFAIGSRVGDSEPCIRYSNRFVRTEEFISEERAGRILYRGFGTNRPGGLWANLLRLRFKNAANTNVIYHGGKLLALWEGGLPHLLDPVTLDTLQRYDFDGALKNPGSAIERLLQPDLPFSAHPKVDPQTGELFNFGLVAGKQYKVLLYSLRPGGSLQHLAQVPLPEVSFIHDFNLTPNWCVFFVYPVAFDVPRYLSGLAAPADTLRQVEGAPTQVLLVPRAGGEPRFLTADPCFVFHFANAFERPDGHIVVDGARMSGYPELRSMERLLRGDLADLPELQLTRFVIDPEAPAQTRVTQQDLGGPRIELPRVNPLHTGLPYRYAYGVCGSRQDPLQVIAELGRIDTQTGESVKCDFTRSLPGEPVMVPRPGATAEDDGWILSVVYRGEVDRSALYVLDARDLSTVCVAEMPIHAPPGFHGNFVPEADCPPGWYA